MTNGKQENNGSVPARCAGGAHRHRPVCKRPRFYSSVEATVLTFWEEAAEVAAEEARAVSALQVEQRCDRAGGGERV